MGNLNHSKEADFCSACGEWTLTYDVVDMHSNGHAVVRICADCVFVGMASERYYPCEGVRVPTPTWAVEDDDEEDGGTDSDDDATQPPACHLTPRNTDRPSAKCNRDLYRVGTSTDGEVWLCAGHLNVARRWPLYVRWTSTEPTYA